MKKLHQLIKQSIGWYGVVLLICGIFFICRFKPPYSLISLFLYFDRAQLNRPYTYKVERDSPEYITFERVGDTSYKVSFHKTPHNPGTDYFIISNKSRTGYPPIKCRYLDTDANEVFVSLIDFGNYYLDTVVTTQYRLISTPDLLKVDTLEYPQPMSVKALELSHQRMDWIDSIRNLPFRENVYAVGNQIEIDDSLSNNRIAPIVIK